MEAYFSKCNTTIKNGGQIPFAYYYNILDVAFLTCNAVSIMFMFTCLVCNIHLRKRTDLNSDDERGQKPKEFPKYFCHNLRNIVLLLLIFFNFLNCIEVFIRWIYSSSCAASSNIVPVVPCASLSSVILAIVFYEYLERIAASQIYLFIPLLHWCLTVIVSGVNIFDLFFKQNVGFASVAPSLLVIICTWASVLIIIDSATVLKLVLKKRKRKRSLEINHQGNETKEKSERRKKRLKVRFQSKNERARPHRIQGFSEQPHSGSIQYDVTFSPSGNDEIARESDRNYDEERRNPEDKLKYCHDVSFLSKFTYSWYVKILKRGWQRPLEFMDLERVTDAFASKKQFEKFEGNYSAKKENSEEENPSLWRVIFITYRGPLFYAGLLKMLGDLLNVVGPVAILPIVDYVRQIQEGTLVLRGEFRNDIYYVGWMEFFKNGWTLSFLAFVASILESNISQESARIGANEGIRAKTALQAKLFDKTLKMSVSGAKCFRENDDEAREDSSDCVDSGSALNYVLKDTENIMMFFTHFHYIWAIPFKISCIIAILYMEMGISAVYGTLITVVTLILLQFLLAKKMKIYNKLADDESDSRLKKTKEAIGFIRCLKTMALEEVLIKNISDIRERELRFLLIEGILKALLMFVTQASGIVIILLTFSFYNLIEGQTPDEGIIFSSLALFSNLMVALFLFPVVAQHLIRAAVSMHRLQNYLSLPEVSIRTVTFNPDISENEKCSKSDEANECVVVEKASFSYGITAEDQVVLSDISTSIEIGKVTMVLGNVGSGKSSFLLSLLGEITKVVGNVHWKSDGNVAFVCQNPWLINASLRQNILMGKRFTPRKYNNVISLCALQPDIAILSEGDLTEIGKGGVGLSGGQKQRVSLARALYSDHPFIFMDCPFSALDTAIAEEVFKNILDFHSKKNTPLTLVIATHHPRFLSRVHKVIYLDNKTIEFQGTPEAVSIKYPHLLEKLNSLYLENMTLKSSSRVYNLLSQRIALSKYLNRIAQLKRKNSTYVMAEEFMESLANTKRRDRSKSSFPLRASLLPSDEIDSFSSYSPRKRSPSFIPKDYLFSTSLCENLDIETRRRTPFNRRHAKSLPSRPRKSQLSFNGIENIEHESTMKDLRRKESFVRKLFNSPSIKSKRSLKRTSNARSNSKIWSLIFGRGSDIPEEGSETADSNCDEEELSDVGSDDSSEVFKSFIDEKDGKKGKISKWNYVVYLKACGWALGSLYVIFMIANQGALVALDLWLGRWSKMCHNGTCNWNQTRVCSGNEHGGDMNNSNKIFSSANISSNEVMKSSNECMQNDSVGFNSYISTFSLLAGSAIFIGLISILLNQFAAHKGRRTLHDKLLEAVVYAKNRVFDCSNAFGRITIRFTSDINTIDKELGWSIMHFTYFALICFSAIVVNSVISPVFILLALPLCIIYYAIQHIFKCSSRELKRIELASQSPVASLVNEIAEYPPVIRAYGIQSKFFSCFCRRIDSYLSSYVLFHAGNRWLGISLDYLGSCIVFLATVACLLGSTIDLGFLLSPLTVGFAIKYTLSIPTYLHVLVRYLMYTESGLSSVERIQEYAKLKPEETFEINITDCKICMGKCRCRRSRKRRHHSILSCDKEKFLPRNRRDHLVFENVSLYYTISNPVINNISFSIQVKQKVGICGRTGSGKSSILSGILRMLEWQEGSIYLNGIDILKVPLTVLRKNIAVVTQDVCVFEDSIRFNVDPENSHSDSEIWSALEKVHLKEMVSNLPDKLESLIGAGNLTLSSGQAQLLVISRILLEKKNLVLLDEFGAHLDVETEGRILAIIKKEFIDSTVIMVTHNTSCLLSCDRILSISEGKIVEDGSPKELSQKSEGVFSSLLKAANV